MTAPPHPADSAAGSAAAVDAAGVWQRLHAEAAALGLTVAVVVDRATVEPHFPEPPARDAGGAHGATPGRLHPGYRRAVVLGSGGRRLWQRFRQARAGGVLPAENPLDAFSARQVGRLLDVLRPHDPHVRAGFPFRHPHQIVPFPALLAGLPPLHPGPFGLSVDAEYGPWLAWRGALFTALALPLTAVPPAPCDDCAAPCVAACPAGAVQREGFDWRACGDFRLAADTCRDTCPARQACPAGAAHRYDDDQMRYHYRAGLRELQQMRK